MKIGIEAQRLYRKKKAGMDSTKYSSHQLRAGGATDYISFGVPVELVKDMGRRKLMDSMNAYRKLDPKQMCVVAQRWMRKND